jgi:hypothetical protein
MALRIEVTAYSGYRGEETPRAFVMAGRRVEVVEITGTWVEEAIDTRARKRFFKLRGDDGKAYTIYYDDKSRGWFYMSGDETGLLEGD